MVVHPEFIRGYDAASKAKQLIIGSRLAGTRAAADGDERAD